MQIFLPPFSSPSRHACFLFNPHNLAHRLYLPLLLSTLLSPCAIHSLNLSCPFPYQEPTRSLPWSPPHHLRLRPHPSPPLCWIISQGCLTTLSSQGSLGTTGTFSSFLVTVFRLSLTVVTLRSTSFQAYCVPHSVQYPQFNQASMAVPMGCSFENSHQVYGMGDSGEHLTPTEGFSHSYNGEYLVRPQFVPY